MTGPSTHSNGLADELAEAKRDLDQLSFSVSHDLRAPLRAISGYAAILADDYSGNLDAEGQRMLQAIQTNASKLSDQIAAILEYSRAGRRELQPVAVDMTDLFQEVWAEIQPPHRTVRFELEALPSVVGDHAALRTIVGKLLDNAVKFSTGCEQPVIQVAARSEPPHLCFEVRDNGAGFDPAYAGKLFGMFQRLHTADEFTGLGTGLAVAHLLLQRQGGWIRADAAVNGGACFTFGLPAPPEAAA